MIVIGVATVAPHVIFAYQKAREVYRILPGNVLQALAGFIFCFFGGLFPTLLAALEAARLSGWDETVRSINIILEESAKVVEESKKDDEVDDDGDGIADVNQISGNELVMRKAKLIMTKMEPERVNDALSGLYISWLAVMATLKVQFARTVTMALSIAHYLEGPAMHLEEPLKRMLPKDYHKWIPVCIRWGCKSIGMSIAWSIQRIISAFTSAIKGGLMISRGVMDYCVEHGHNPGGLIPKDLDDTYIDEVAGWSLAVLGFYIQFSFSFTAPFPFNILLMPFTLLEWYIQWAVTSA